MRHLPEEVHIERFWAKVDKSGDCWIWQGSKTNGYGVCSFMGRHTRAHRVSYELLVGPIPEGLHMDHLCCVRDCVNPDHLEPVTQAENNRRMLHWNTKKDACPRGHEYDGVAYRGDGSPFRFCKECARETKRRYKARKKAERLE